MKIVSLETEGFRSLKHVIWRPGDLNILIGANGSGKSNLLQLLELASASARKQLGAHVQAAGGIWPLLWDGTANGLRFEVVTTDVGDSDRDSGVSLAYAVHISLGWSGSSYRVDSERLTMVTRGEGRTPPVVSQLLKREKERVWTLGEGQSSPTLLPEGIVKADETALPEVATPSSNWRTWMFNYRVAAWCSYHDISTGRTAAVRQPPVSRHEEQVAVDGQNLANVLHTLYTADRAFRQRADAAMAAAFGDEYEELVFPPAASQRIELQVRWKSLSRACPAADLSDGTLRFLFLIAVLATPKPPPLIAIDEPETGLHPSMLPIIAEYAADAATRTQVIFTTHSPEFLDAFSGLDRTVTVAKWADGETTLHTLDDEALQLPVELGGSPARPPAEPASPRRDVRYDGGHPQPVFPQSLDQRRDPSTLFG